MGNGVFNISKGKIAEYAERIIANDPANSAFIVLLATGTLSDAGMEDYEDLAALLANPNIAEATFGGYNRKTITAPTVSVDHAGNSQRVYFISQQWTAAIGNDLTRFIVCYDEDTTGGGDVSIIPCTFHDFVFTTRGALLTAGISVTTGFQRTF